MLLRVKLFLNEINPLYLFIIAIIIDIVSMNLFVFFDQKVGNIIYFVGQSLAMVFYVYTIVQLSKPYFVINIIASVWITFAISDLCDELFFNNLQATLMEYIAGVIGLLIVVYKVRKRKRVVNNVR